MGGSCSQVPSWHTNAPRETYAWTGTSAARAQSPGRHTCTPRRSATTRGLQGHRNAYNPFEQLAHTYTRTHLESLTQSHVQIRWRPAAPSPPALVSAGAGGEGRWPRRPRRGSDPSPAPHRHKIQSERGGGGAGWGAVRGVREGTRLLSLFPCLLPGSVDFLSPPASLEDQTFPSLTSPPAASSADLGWNPEFPRTLPGKGVGEVAPQWTKGGRGLARARGPVGRAARRRWPGARAPRAWCADFCLLSPGQRRKSRGTSV